MALRLYKDFSNFKPKNRNRPKVSHKRSISLMRYAPFNCAKFSLFSALSQSRNPAVVCQMAAIKTKGRITGGSENVCIYVGNRRVTSALVLSTEQLFGTGTAQYIVS